MRVLSTPPPWCWCRLFRLPGFASLQCHLPHFIRARFHMMRMDVSGHSWPPLLVRTPTQKHITCRHYRLSMRPSQRIFQTAPRLVSDAFLCWPRACTGSGNSPPPLRLRIVRRQEAGGGSWPFINYVPPCFSRLRPPVCTLGPACGGVCRLYLHGFCPASGLRDHSLQAGFLAAIVFGSPTSRPPRFDVGGTLGSDLFPLRPAG